MVAGTMGALAEGVNDEAAEALMGYCGLPSPNWRGSGAHLWAVEGTVWDCALGHLEAALAGFESDHDTWARWEPEELTEAARPSRMNEEGKRDEEGRV